MAALISARRRARLAWVVLIWAVLGIWWPWPQWVTQVGDLVWMALGLGLLWGVDASRPRGEHPSPGAGARS